jgi:hypothetical protein
MRIVVMNGWKEARHCWPHFWKLRVERAGDRGHVLFVAVSWLGFSVYFCPRLRPR